MSRKSSHEKSLGLHDSLCDLVAELAKGLGHHVRKHVVYKHGELDVYIDNHIYMEIKYNYNDKNFLKARRQTSRAGKYGMCDIGFMVWKDGITKVYDKNEESKTDTRHDYRK